MPDKVVNALTHGSSSDLPPEGVRECHHVAVQDPARGAVRACAVTELRMAHAMENLCNLDVLWGTNVCEITSKLFTHVS